MYEQIYIANAIIINISIIILINKTENINRSHCIQETYNITWSYGECTL